MQFVKSRSWTPPRSHGDDDKAQKADEQLPQQVDTGPSASASRGCCWQRCTSTDQALARRVNRLQRRGCDSRSLTPARRDASSTRSTACRAAQ
jgi:hypothetical protein